MRTSSPREGRSWPGYMFGGRLRTSTAVLLIAFCLVSWLYASYEPARKTPAQVPATEVVPPGFIPDPDYTWAPRTDVQHRSTTTQTETPTHTTPTSTNPASPTSSAESANPTTPAQPGQVTPAPSSTAGSAVPAPSSPAAQPGAPSTSERPAAQAPTKPVPAGETTATTALPTR